MKFVLVSCRNGKSWQSPSPGLARVWLGLAWLAAWAGANTENAFATRTVNLETDKSHCEKRALVHLLWETMGNLKDSSCPGELAKKLTRPE